MKQVIHNAQSHHTDYAGGFIYEDDLLKMILTPEGRIIKNISTTYDPQYFIKDYLGNTRVVFHANATTGNVEVLQEDHYDPLGMKLGGLGMVADAENRFLFQGKELNNDAIDLNNDGDPDTYLNWYDFEARNYDPQIGRWHVPDPVNQTASPYVSMGNNPVRFIDPNGCAYVGYGSLADRFYRSYYTDPNGHEGRLGPEGSIFTKVSPEDQSELAAMIEIGQAAGDDFHGESWQSYLDKIYGRGAYGLSNPLVNALGIIINVNNIWLSDFGVNYKKSNGLSGWVSFKDYASNKYSAGFIKEIFGSINSIVDRVRIARVSSFENVPVYEINSTEENKGSAFTLPGIGIFCSAYQTGDSRTDLLRHEFGHILQARYWGLGFYLSQISPTSVKSFSTDLLNHCNTWTEWSANQLSWRYFGQPEWNTEIYPLWPASNGSNSWPGFTTQGDFLINWIYNH